MRCSGARVFLTPSHVKARFTAAIVVRSLWAALGEVCVAGLVVDAVLPGGVKGSRLESNSNTYSQNWPLSWRNGNLFSTATATHCSFLGCSRCFSPIAHQLLQPKPVRSLFFTNLQTPHTHVGAPATLYFCTAYLWVCLSR